jgi:uroporphyrinogen-III synthase
MRILVTRAKEDAARTARKLMERGHEPVLAPVIEMMPLETAMPKGSWDAIIATSAHAAPALKRLADKARPLFAVGPHTASAAAQAGFAMIHESQGDARALADAVQSALPQGARLLHVTGRHRKAEPQATLTEAGFDIEAWETYEARAVLCLPSIIRERLEAQALDAALHYSRRSAEILLSLARKTDCCPAFLALRHVCLSADVAAPFEKAGARHIILAPEPREESLLGLLQARESP